MNLKNKTKSRSTIYSSKITIKREKKRNLYSKIQFMKILCRGFYTLTNPYNANIFVTIPFQTDDVAGPQHHRKGGTPEVPRRIHERGRPPKNILHI